MHYFAYGVNMNHASMKQRCPDSKFVGPAFLLQHELVFDGQSRLREGATANIVPNQNGCVWGGLYYVAKSDLEALDEFEGNPLYYTRQEVKVFNGEDVGLNAWVYLRSALARGKPGQSYLQEMLQGAMQCQLPPGYIVQKIQSRA